MTVSTERNIIAMSGSIRVARNTPEAIESGVHALLDDLLGSSAGAVISCVIASSLDLEAAFPAAAARRWGLSCPVMGLTSAHAGPRLLEALAHVHQDPCDE